MSAETDIMTIVYDWCSEVLNTFYNKGLPIIYGTQNNQRPAPPYIVVHWPISIKKTGLSNRYGTDDAGIRDVVTNYVIVISIEQVYHIDETQPITNHENYLELLLAANEQQDLQDFLRGRNAAFIDIPDIRSIPQTVGEEIQLRSSMDCTFTFTNSFEENTSYIDDVDITNNI